MKIFIIDDSPEIIEVLYNALPKHYKFQVALSGEKALQFLNETDELPDLILLDVMMPGINGFEVCIQLKKDIRYKDIPIIFISGLDETFDKIKAFKIGGVDYITKPFQSEEVKVRVSTHLEISYSRKEIKDLYSKTLQGVISAMNDILAVSNPQVSRVSNAMRFYAEMIMKELSIEVSWDLKLACLLSGIGLLPEAIKQNETRYFTNIDNTVNSRNINTTIGIGKVIESLSLSIKVIENIPKFEPIVKIIKESMSPFDKNSIITNISDLNLDLVKAQILRVLIHYFYKRQNDNYILVFKQMKNDSEEFYLPEILDALHKVQNHLSSSDISEVTINELKPRMIIVEDLLSAEGKVLLKAGYEFTERMIVLLKNSSDFKSIKIKVINKLSDILAL